MIVLRRARSARFARRIAAATTPSSNRKYFLVSPRLRSVIVVPPAASSHTYVVSMGNGPDVIDITSRSLGTNACTSYAYSRVRPRKRARNRNLEPTAIGGGDGGGAWTGGFFRGMLRGPLVSMFVGQHLGAINSKVTKEDLEAVAELIEAGAVTPVVGRTYPLREAPEAVRVLETGHAEGKLVIAI